jgi:hypothetical protein
MPYFRPEEITAMIDNATNPSHGSPEVALVEATRAQAAATLFVGEVLNEILAEMQLRGCG